MLQASQQPGQTLYMPCEHCAVRELTPHIGPEGGTTLAEDIESWVTDVDELVGGD